MVRQIATDPLATLQVAVCTAISVALDGHFDLLNFIPLFLEVAKGILS